MKRAPGRPPRPMIALLVGAAALLAQDRVEAQARDTHLVWLTVRTRHFEVHYHEPLGIVARRVAAVAERAHGVLARALDHRPDERTHIVLSDTSDAANGSASAVPFNFIRLFATGPSDLSALADHDDWLTELITHEHTHVLHLDTIGGIPALINAVFGKVFPPNAAQPRWFVEGLAVYEESTHTTGGRLRSSMFDMYLRMDALSGNLLRLDQISNTVDRWPRGNVWYLYGSRFVQFIADRHGAEALRRMSHDYGRQVIPYGLNRTARRATGRTFVQLYDDFLAHTAAQYQATAARIRAEGLAQGRPLTHHGEYATTPRFLDDGRIVYAAADGREHSQLRAIDGATGAHATEIVRVAGTGEAAPHPDGQTLYYSSIEVYRDIYSFYDLFRVDLATGRSTQLTHGMRARAPDVAPDGTRIAFTVNGASTTHLAVADLSDIEGSRRILMRNRRFEQVYTPRWSPDGRRIAFSRWRRGGFRDIQVVDVQSGRVQAITRDRALDTGPAWSPDGRWLYFSSDRTGIANIYAHEMATGQLRQVTHVLAGAFQPAVSADGRRLVYVGYSHLGFDLHTMPLDPNNFRTPLEPLPPRPAAAPAAEVPSLTSEAYNPWSTLSPRGYAVEWSEDGFGPALGIIVEGGDVVGYHRYTARLGVGMERGNLNADVTWSIERSPLPISVSLFRHVAPRRGLFVAGERRRWIAGSYGASIGASYRISRDFRTDVVSLSYSVTQVEKLEPFGGRLDPNDPPPRLPETGLVGSLAASWSWSDAVRTTFDISASEGRSLRFRLSVAHPLFGSRFQAITASWRISQFIENPLIAHHVLAIRYAGGLSGGDVGRRGTFAVGGFPSVPVIDALLENQLLGGVALRGYKPFHRTGIQFHLVQTEYRFPLLRPYRGLGTLPAYLYRVWALVFADAGNAFYGRFDASEFLVGVGAELLIEFTLGYLLPYTLRIGLARGLGDGGATQLYAHLGLPF